MSLLTLKIFVFRKYRLIFAHCHYFTLFLSTSGTVSVKTGEKHFPVSYDLRSEMVLYSTNGFFVLILCVSIFKKNFEHNCIFYEFIFFPCGFTRILTCPIEGKHGRENAQRWKMAYLDMSIVSVI